MLVLSTELISVTPVVQPGGLTLGFALHLVKGNQWLCFTPDAVSVSVVCMQTDQILQLSAFVDAEVDYHRQSVDILQRLLESLRERSVC